MSNETRRPAGAMTRAMSTKRAQDERPRVLRLGVLQRETMIEERIVRERATVTVGTTERATVTLHAEDFPAHAELFVVRDGRWHLRIDPKADGRVAAGDAVRSVAEWRTDPRCAHAGDACLLPLDDASRGKVTLAGVTFLFQFVPPPPEAPRPQVPMALRRSLAREMDWRYNASLACFLSVAIGSLAWIEYGYDPIVDDNAELLELVSRRVRMMPFSDTPEPDAPPSDPAEASAAPADGPPSTTPRPHATPSPHTPRTPRVPSNAQVAQEAQRAEAAAASAASAIEASFGAITTVARGPNSAVDQLNNQVLMAGTADDLRNVGAITTRAPSGVTRTTTTAANLPGGQRLGEHRAVATTEGPSTSAQVVEREVCRNCFTPERAAPETDTCDADAGAVARVIRGNLGGIRACYERIARTNHTLRGRLMMRFTVGESGRATSVSVTGVDDALDQCVERALSRLVFPPPTCGAADFEYPVTVSPSE